MHLPDHLLDPATMTTTSLLSSGAVAYSLIRLRDAPQTTVLRTAAVAAAVFAAQMVNFAVASDTSGHLVGGAMAGMLLGPWAGVLAMSAVLAVQAVVFGDGGIFALGANILNMGIIGVAIGVAIQPLFSSRHFKAGNGLLARALAAALAGWLGVELAALACALEIAVSGSALAGEVVPAMLRVHAVIGLAEGAISAVVITAGAYFAAQYSRAPSAIGRYGVGAIAALATVIVIAMAPFASSLPDGLEKVAEGLSSLSLQATANVSSVFSDYALPGIAWAPAATILAGLLGVAIVYGATALACAGVRKPL